VVTAFQESAIVSVPGSVRSVRHVEIAVVPEFFTLTAIW